MKPKLLLVKSHSAFKILPEKQLILEYYSGILLPEILLSNKIKIKNHQGFNPGFNVFFDIRDTEIAIPKEDVILLLEFVKRSPDIYGSIKMAFLTSEPNHVVAVSLLELYKGDLNIYPKIFSTIKSAIRWLYDSCNVDQDILEQVKLLRDSNKTG